MTSGSALATKEVFTTSEAAEVCNVSAATIIRCFDSGRLRGFRVPGSRFRRIPRGELLAFMRDHGIPTERLEVRVRRALVVCGDARLREELVEGLRRLGAEARAAATGFDAGLLTERLRPHLLVIDAALSDVNAASVTGRVRACKALGHTRVVVLEAGVPGQQVARPAGVQAVVSRRLPVPALLEQLAPGLREPPSE